MAALPKSKFSGSNIVLLIVCLMVIIAVLLLNIFNAKNLAQLRSYLNSLSSDNSKVDVLRNTNKELLEAENSYRLYLSTKDTLYSNKYLSHLVSCVNDLTAIKSSNDTVGVSAIIAGIEQKIQVSDAIDLLKRISDSISISKISANNGGFYINPYWYRMSNNSILKGYDSLMQQTEIELFKDPLTASWVVGPTGLKVISSKPRSLPLPPGALFLILSTTSDTFWGVWK